MTLLLAPAVFVLLLLFSGGLILALGQSLGWVPLLGMRRISLDAYLSVLSSRGFLRSLRLTLFVATVSTALTIVIAIITALCLRHVLRGRRLLGFLYQIPLTVPHLVIAVAVLMLASQSGLFSRLLFHLGLITVPAAFPELVNDDWGIGITLVYVWKQVPFVGLVALSVLQSVGEDYEEIARSLGANAFQRVRYVLLPLMIPAIAPASVIIFAFVFGAFEVPFLLGKSFPTMLSVLAYRLYTDVDLARRPQAMALNVLIALIVLGLLSIHRRVSSALTERQNGR
jgi:putative spermidine/putrescine transport system permease protein